MRGGGLWKAFQEAVHATNPWAVWMTKVKGHATEEEVQQGTVQPEDKEGNDYADEAAGKGSHTEQEMLSAIASLYSRRNKPFQTFVRRVRKNFLGVKMEETAQRATKINEANHFADKDKNKVALPEKPNIRQKGRRRR